MAFPEAKRVIFKQNPLREVICQLRFPTILEIGAEPPVRFQNNIRSTYPLYSLERPLQNLPPEISSILEQLRVPLPTQHQILTHKFATAEGTRFISLNPEFVAFTERKYQRWEHFRTDIETATTTLEEVYTPAFYLRVGLRYQDVIDRKELGLDDPWHALINAPLVGMLGAENLRDEVQDIQTESLIKVTGVRGGFVRLRHGLRKVAPDGHQVYVIDSDFYTSERSGKDDVLGILDEFRRVAGNLFRWAATSRLQQALEPMEVG